jgi:hypothetical protein
MEHHDRIMCLKENEHEDTKFGSFDHKFYISEESVLLL